MNKTHRKYPTVGDDAGFFLPDGGKYIPPPLSSLEIPLPPYSALKKADKRTFSLTALIHTF